MALKQRKIATQRPGQEIVSIPPPQSERRHTNEYGAREDGEDTKVALACLLETGLRDFFPSFGRMYDDDAALLFALFSSFSVQLVVLCDSGGDTKLLLLWPRCCAGCNLD